MKPEFTICLIFVFGLLFLFAIHVAHDEKRIIKARKALHIPHRYHHHLKYLLFSIYNDHHYMYRLSDEEFRQMMMKEQLPLYKEIQHRLNLLISIDGMIVEDDLYQHPQPQRTLAEVLNKYHIL